MEPAAWPRLLADVGGTNARFAIETGPHAFDAIDVLPCAAYPGLAEAARAYLDALSLRRPGMPPVRHAAIAIATPVDGDLVAMTNHHWRFSIASLRERMGWEVLEVVNDFTALAMALPYLGPRQRPQVGGGIARAGAPIALIGPGTGLGVSGLVPGAGGWTPLATEGGHVSFSPNDDFEDLLLAELRRSWPHASAERLLSGPGLEFIHRVASAGHIWTAPEITRAALDGSCAHARRAVDAFCAILGSTAGNVALTLGATGGVYIGGGIVPRLGSLFGQSRFRARFEAKGRLSAYMEGIPTYWIAEPHPAFPGIAALLARRIAAVQPGMPS